ncbi:MAG: histidinol dehydrogenase [Proteobacteria bacterium]|nr:histidinol dehydrogenase [Pseudomonadota bacterium]
MIIPSIDIQGGQAVQLVGGKDLAIEAGDPLAWARRFGAVGEVAVVDLDAALRQGDNTRLITAVAEQAEVRVGGGIRSFRAATDWLDRGVAKIVIGTAARPELLSRLPPERVVAALDAVDGEVVVDGWRSRTGVSILERMRELEGLVGGFLVTFVEREGRLGGTNLDRVAELVEAAGSARLTIAGGVTTAGEVAALDRLGAEAQVGMALYSGRMNLGDAFTAPLVSDRPDGLWPTVVTDERGVALGLVYSSAESVREALETGRGVYQSRTRGLWRKGESSGNIQELLSIRTDCDRDSLRFVVRQKGPSASFCHTGSRSCFGEDAGLGRLERTLASRIADAPAGSYTRRLLDDPVLLGSKLGEEAGELAEATGPADVAAEAADVIYFAAVAMARAGVGFADVEKVLDRRARKLTRRPGNAKPDKVAEFRALTRTRQFEPSRAEPVDPLALDTVRPILEAVENEGMDAVRRYAEQFGDAEAGQDLVLGRDALVAALNGLDTETRGVLERTATRIRGFAEAQRAAVGGVSVPISGGLTSSRLQPVERAGCYAPGGRFPLPSSVLMTALTAKAAGVQEVWVASPRPTAVTLAAAALAGAAGVLAVGGAQAIGALTYGAGAVPPCDVIVGPGNRYVTAAKQTVSGRVAIDLPAGPSELLVAADDSACAATIAADLLAQAEHDPDARVCLVTPSSALIDRVDEALRRQLTSLPTRSTAEAALVNAGTAVLVEDWSEAVEVINAVAPEHLELQGPEARAIEDQLTSYGAIFVGEGAAEVLGDYGAGPNHVLPTGGSARSYGGLSVLSFLRLQARLEVFEADRGLLDDTVALARLEGLEGHARAAEVRVDLPNDRPPLGESRQGLSA